MNCAPRLFVPSRNKGASKGGGWRGFGKNGPQTQGKTVCAKCVHERGQNNTKGGKRYGIKKSVPKTCKFRTNNYRLRGGLGGRASFIGRKAFRSERRRTKKTKQFSKVLTQKRFPAEKKSTRRKTKVFSSSVVDVERIS